jgi:hypothetical protein
VFVVLLTKIRNSLNVLLSEDKYQCIDIPSPKILIYFKNKIRIIYLQKLRRIDPVNEVDLNSICDCCSNTFQCIHKTLHHEGVVTLIVLVFKTFIY